MPRINFEYAGVFKPDTKLGRAREKFCAGIDRQISAITDPSYRYRAADGCMRRPHSWVSYDFTNDSAHVGLRYGAHFLRRNDVPFGIVVPKATPPRIVSALKVVKRDVMEGKLDVDLMEARSKCWL